MSAAVTAYLDTFAGSKQDPDPVLYIERDQVGPLLAVSPRGGVEERFRLPDGAVELIHPDTAIEHVLKRMADVEMPDTVRAAIAERLCVDVEKVGTARRRGAA